MPETKILRVFKPYLTFDVDMKIANYALEAAH